ncbi:hypothetical protein J2D73_16655 [Acetobacter sacchari]|uniref:Uncharacterized protein n=1 Tax=Acetobacter sacchari TaxID=2661687 RepID=A0ABS3LZS0_9PROT|nr:hypothetical protein [Acetobacter sacchari]MBO1361417.1 hypothetical protein [Acetobacter sacchari]
MSEAEFDREIASSVPIIAPAPRAFERCLASLRALRPRALQQALRAGGPHIGVIYRWIGEAQIRLEERARRLSEERTSPAERQMVADSAAFAVGLAKMRVDRWEKMTPEELATDIAARPLCLYPKDF